MRDEKRDRTTRNIGQWVQAVIFDLDGVVTDTAEAQARAWKQMFDDYLETLGRRKGNPYRRFDREEDYRRHVDGKPRYDGVRSFLQSRGIELETGSPNDPPRRETIWGLANRKNEIYQHFIDKGLVKVFPAAVRLIRQLKSKKIKTAVVSSRKNCQKADSPGPNNNAYTNVMAVWVLERALEILEILPEFNQERSDLLRHQALFDGIGR